VVGTSPAAAAAIATLSEVVLEEIRDTTDRARAQAATAALLAWDLAAEADLAEADTVAAVVDDADKQRRSRRVSREQKMKSMFMNRTCFRRLRLVAVLAWAFLAAPVLPTTAQSATTKRTASATSGAKLFDTPEQAADALVDAAARFDVDALHEIFGPSGDDIYLTGEYPQDRQRALDFAAEAHEKKSVSVDPKGSNRAFLIVGDEDWPFPVPLVKLGDKWCFDAKAGSQELVYRRIGSNEIDAIDICDGFVNAQYEYAFQIRQGYDVNQFAQHIISTPGKQDGLAWQNPDGSWGGPVGEKIARAIEQGYSATAQPYHGYFFKILKGQGPAAPLGEMNYVVEGAMIGGFALVAAPAEYGVTGLKTFMVSNDGVVYQKDFGPATLNEFIRMERFNPDQSWTPVLEEQGRDLEGKSTAQVPAQPKSLEAHQHHRLAQGRRPGLEVGG
jgi:hypothetical protein